MRQLMAMDAAILKTLQYFRQFEYAPTAAEVYTFLPTKTSKIAFYEHLEKMLKNKKAVKYTRKISLSQMKIKNGLFDLSPDIYTVGEYSTKIKNKKLNIKNINKYAENSIKKFSKVRRYINILKYFPQIKLVGISGSVAMLNADEKADVDLFIITSQNRLWTGRFIAWSLATLMGIKRGRVEKNAQNKVCLNLFFDEQNMSLPQEKRGEYGGHEVLQMKPIVIKNNSYRRFLDANKWVFRLFPNAKQEVYRQDKDKRQGDNHANRTMGDFMEKILRNLQLYFINKHKTTELITETQLWFHPEDYSKKVKPHPDCSG